MYCYVTALTKGMAVTIEVAVTEATALSPFQQYQLFIAVFYS